MQRKSETHSVHVERESIGLCLRDGAVNVVGLARYGGVDKVSGAHPPNLARQVGRQANEMSSALASVEPGSEDQKSQSSSSVATALPMTYDEPDPLKKSWFSSAFGDRAERIAGFTFVTLEGNIAS